MNVLDSSAWIEYFNDGPAADAFEPIILEPSVLIVPSICITEVRRYTIRFKDLGLADQFVGAMLQGIVVDLDAQLAAFAAEVGIEHRLPLADSIIYATAQARDATLWTMDADFQGLPGVEYLARKG